MKYSLLSFRLLMLFIFVAGNLSAQNHRQDSVNLNIGAVNKSAIQPRAKDNNDGFALAASTAVLHTFNQTIKDTFMQRGIFMPGFTIYFGKKSSGFIEMSMARASRMSNKPTYVRLNYFTTGICNQVTLNDRLSLRQKLGFSVLIIKTENFYLNGSTLHGGFLGGAGLQTKATDNLFLYFDANYMYQPNNLGGLRWEPGIMLQF